MFEEDFSDLTEEDFEKMIIDTITMYRDEQDKIRKEAARKEMILDTENKEW